MSIEVAKPSILRRCVAWIVKAFHGLITGIVHPRTGAAVEVIYAGHSLAHADGNTAIAIYVALMIVAVGHFIWTHVE